MRWMEPFLRDYFTHESNLRGAMAATQNMMGSFNGFKKEIRRMFGDIDEVKTATNLLYNVKQTGSVINYSTEFQKHANKTNWDTTALMSMYEKGLKDHIRIELARKDNRPLTMVSLIEETVRIDNVMQEFRNKPGREERRRESKPWKKHHGKKGYKHEGNKENRYSNTMELDATHKKKLPSKDAMRSKGLCFECGLPGHLASSHNKKGQSWKGKTKQINAATMELCATQRVMIEEELDSDDELDNDSVNQPMTASEQLDAAITREAELLMELREGRVLSDVEVQQTLDQASGRIANLEEELGGRTEDNDEFSMALSRQRAEYREFRTVEGLNAAEIQEEMIRIQERTRELDQLLLAARTEEELENANIATQVEPPPAYDTQEQDVWEWNGRPLFTAEQINAGSRGEPELKRRIRIRLRALRGQNEDFHPFYDTLTGCGKNIFMDLLRDEPYLDGDYESSLEGSDDDEEVLPVTQDEDELSIEGDDLGDQVEQAIHEYRASTILPKVGSSWRVVRIKDESETLKSREWWDPAASRFYHEYFDALANGPRVGEYWQVIHRDPRRIGWRDENGKFYLQRLPPQKDRLKSLPRVGDIWEMLSQGNGLRTWTTADLRSNVIYEERYDNSIGREHPIVGHLYEVRFENNGGRGWKDLATRQIYIEKRAIFSWDQPHELNATGSLGQLYVVLSINGKKARAMIDTGASGNFMSPDAVMHLGLKTELKEEPYQLQVVDGNAISHNNGLICCETEKHEMTMHHGHKERIQFDVVPIGRHQIILGMPWVKKHNPDIDWLLEKVQFTRCKCASPE